MPTNIEIKAVVRNWEELRHRAETLSDTPLEIIEQDDTFFICPTGRLKLRQFSETRGQLIAYERADVAEAKTSCYLITETPEPDVLRQVLSRALGILGIVKKKRFLYLHGQIRIHLDQVENLGNYMELEVVLSPDQPAAEGEELARELMGKLGVKSGDLVAGAYLDKIPRQT